jgi:hypothetical protein
MTADGSGADTARVRSGSYAALRRRTDGGRGHTCDAAAARRNCAHPKTRVTGVVPKTSVADIGHRGSVGRAAGTTTGAQQPQR